MTLVPIQTQDGSFTLYNTELDEIYHSRRGALQESLHVFIKNGLLLLEIPQVKIVEVGFGTGLNFWLCWLLMNKKIENIILSEKVKHLEYIGIEPFLPPKEIIKEIKPQLFDLDEFNQKIDYLYEHLNENIIFDHSTNVSLNIIQKSLFDVEISDADIIFYDVFGYRVAADLWSEAALNQTKNFLKIGGLFVTYCSKSIVRKTLVNLGFEVKKVPGPEGKREMIIAKRLK